MTCTLETVGSCVTLTVRGERSRRILLHYLAAAMFLLAVHYFFYRSTARAIAEGVGVLWALATLARQQFGVSILQADEERLLLYRQTFRIGRRRFFPRSDVERLGYEPMDQYDDAAIAVMVRTAMMPIRFAHGISASDATSVFEKIRASNSWLAILIRPVGEPMF